MTDTFSFSERMKGYEAVSKIFLEKKKPVIIRLDGKAFHTFTKGLEKPFDKILSKTMQDTMLQLCENIQNCVLGYTQSDEISLLLADYYTEETDAWFGNAVQKICSISSSMATLYFNKCLLSNYQNEMHNLYGEEELDELAAVELMDRYNDKFFVAMFDSRCFNLEFNEVNNYFFYRQRDAMRNSVQALAQSQYSHKELQNKSSKELDEMLKSEKNIYWEELETYLKWGSCAIKKPMKIQTENGETTRNKWELDLDIPLFVEDRDYIERLVKLND